MTPRQFAELSRRHKESNQHTEILFAQLTAHAINTSFRAPEKAVEADQFMLNPFPKREKRDPKMDARRANGLALAKWIEHLKKEGAFIVAKQN